LESFFTGIRNGFNNKHIIFHQYFFVCQNFYLRKKLLQEVYEKASSEATETSFNGILLHLEQILKDEFEPLSYKSFETYYKTIVENEEDYNIKRSILDNLSRYLGYDNFDSYRSEWKTIEHTIQQAISKLVITIINKPVIKMPEFLTKQSNLGIIGIILCGSLVVGSKMYKADDKVAETQNVGQGLGLLQTLSKQCMYWNGKEYIPEDCNQTKDNLVAIDPKKVANFKKITRPDTIRSIKGIWYSKYQNEVEFFTADGKNPDNNTELHQLTDHMLNKYILSKDSIEE
jgi:hypothetical protein